MAEQIGIRLNLSGASQVQGGLQGVTRSLGDLDARTLKVGDAFRALGPAVAAALSVGTIAAWTKAAIDAADSAGKLAQKIGTTSDQVAGLQMAFRQSGMAADQLTPIMSRLATGIAGGNRALEAMQIATRGADGSLRNTRDVLGDVAQRFASYQDGAAKSALAIELFGRAGANMIPLLNAGAAGLDDMDAKARSLGVAITDQTARAAAKFNDDLDLMNTRMKGLAITIVGPVLQALNKFFGELKDGMETYGSFRAALQDIAFNINPSKTLNENLAQAIKDIKTYQAIIDELKSSSLPDPFGSRARQVANWQRNLDAAIAREQYLLRQINREGGRATDPRARPSANGGAAPTILTPEQIQQWERGRAYIDSLNDAANQAHAQSIKNAEAQALRLNELNKRQAIRKLEEANLSAEHQAEALLLIEENFNLRATKIRQDAQEKARAEEQRTIAAKEKLREEERKKEAAFQALISEANLREAARRQQEIRLEIDLMDKRQLQALTEYEARELAIDASLKSAADMVKAIEEETAGLRMSSEEREISNALLELERKGLEKGTYAYEEYAAKIRSAIVDRNTVRDSIQAAQRIAAEWTRMTDQVGDALANALINGGRSAGETIKRYFSTLILQPIIRAVVDPVARSVLALLGFGGATVAASAGNPAAAGSAPGLLGSLGVSAAQMSAYGGLFTSATQLAGTSWAGTGLAAMHSISSPLGQGIAMGAGTIAGALGPIAIGQMLGRGISGGYSAIGGRSGSSAVNLGTGIGALFGPIGAGIGAAVGGLVNRAFGTKVADTGVQGTFGGEQGFSGSQFEFLRGGWFRSNKTRTSALGSDLQSILGSGFSELRDETLKMARDLGLASESVSLFSKDIKVSLAGLTEEQVAQRLQQELGLVADEMARLAGGAGMTASGLRQLYERVMTERAQLEERLLQLQGDTAELRRRERDALHESNRALYDRIVALQDERDALTRLVDSAASALQKQISASQSAANAARAAAQAYATAGTSLRQTIAALLGSGAPAASAASAYRTGLTAAQGGDAEAMGNLGNLASAYAESLRATARTRSEANIAAARIATELTEVANLGDTLRAQRTVQAALLDINTAALQVLEEDLESGDITVQTLKEHTTLLHSINAALQTTGAIASAMQALDSNVDGLLTFEELQRGLAGKASDDEIRALIARVDNNGDRQISLEEITAERVRQVVLGTNMITNAANGTTDRTNSVAQATGGLIDEQARATSFLVSTDLTLSRVLAKLSEGDPTNLLLIDRITSGNTLVADRLSLVVAAINTQTASQQSEIRRQQDLQRAQADLQSTNAWLISAQRNFQEAQSRLAETPQTISVRVGTRYDVFGFSKGGIYEQQANPAFLSAQEAAANAQAALLGTQSTMQQQRDLIRSLGGVPQFAAGGYHTGGMRLVGERGPELEVTGPARYWSAADTTAMLGNSQRREELLAAEIRALRAEVQGLRAEARVTAVATNKAQRLWERVTRDGESMQITDVTPTP